MNRSQAEWIQEHYQGVPSLRPDQEDLIRYVYPGRTFQRRPWAECSDAQVYRVAERLYLKAAQFDRQPQTPKPVPPDRRNDSSHPDRSWPDPKECARYWRNYLYDIYNIPHDQRDPENPIWVNPDDLEAQLLE